MPGSAALLWGWAIKVAAESRPLGLGGRDYKVNFYQGGDYSAYNLAGRALPGETGVLGLLLFHTSLNDLPPPPMWIAPAVIGQVATRPSPYAIIVQ